MLPCCWHLGYVVVMIPQFCEISVDVDILMLLLYWYTAYSDCLCIGIPYLETLKVSENVATSNAVFKIVASRCVTHIVALGCFSVIASFTVSFGLEFLKFLLMFQSK